MNTINDNQRSLAERGLGQNSNVFGYALVQVYQAPVTNPVWEYVDTGVIAILSDTSYQTYFVRLFSLMCNQITFQQELYQQFEYNVITPWFHSFEMDTSVAALNFSDPMEAQKFFNAIVNCKMKPFKVNQKAITTRTVPQSYSGDVKSRPNPDPLSDMSKKELKELEKKKKKEEKERMKQEKKLKKSGVRGQVIEGPMNVVHVSHIGFDAANGFQIRNIPPEWKQLFQAAKIRKSELQNPETMAFIFKTVNTALKDNDGTMPPLGSAPPPPPPGASMGRPPPPPGGLQRAASNTNMGRPPPPPMQSMSPPPGASMGRPPPPPGGGLQRATSATNIGRMPPPPPGGNTHRPTFSSPPTPPRAPAPPPAPSPPPPATTNVYNDTGYGDTGSYDNSYGYDNSSYDDGSGGYDYSQSYSEPQEEESSQAPTGSLLAGLKNIQLKKVDPQDKSALPDLESESGQTLLSTLSKAMAQRRIDIGKEDDEEEEDDDDWSDDDW